MADPITVLSAIISALVSVFTAYTQYKSAVKRAEAKQEPLPTKTDEATKGEAVAAAVETAITKHGNEDERADLANFQRNPQRYGGTIAMVIRQIAVREPGFAQQLQVLAQQANIAQAGSNVVNIKNEASNYGAQGTFNAPVSFGTLHKADDTVTGDKVAGDKVGSDKVIGEQRNINTGGGDYAEGNIDKRQGTFISGGTVQGSIIGNNQGTVNVNYDDVARGGGDRTVSKLAIVDLRIDVAVPDKTVLNEVFDLAVLVRPPKLPALQEDNLNKIKTGEANVFWPGGQPYISLRVKVRSPDCTIHDADSRSFRLYAGLASPVLYFHLVPRRQGVIGIIVELYQEDDEIGSARVQTAAYEQPVGEVKIKVVAQATASQRVGKVRFAVTEEVQFKRLLLREKQRRLEKLELQSARKGSNTEPEILNEIEDLQKEVEDLKKQLTAYG